MEDSDYSTPPTYHLDIERQESIPTVPLGPLNSLKLLPQKKQRRGYNGLPKTLQSQKDPEILSTYDFEPECGYIEPPIYHLAAEQQLTIPALPPGSLDNLQVLPPKDFRRFKGEIDDEKTYENFYDPKPYRLKNRVKSFKLQIQEYMDAYNELKDDIVKQMNSDSQKQKRLHKALPKKLQSQKKLAILCKSDVESECLYAHDPIYHLGIERQESIPTIPLGGLDNLKVLPPKPPKQPCTATENINGIRMAMDE